MASQKVRKYSFLSFLRKQESSNFKGFWMLDHQHDGFETFCDLVNIEGLLKGPASRLR